MNILLTAGGTGAAWYLASTWNKYFRMHRLIVTDINEKKQVATSTIANAFYRVPPISSPEYLDKINEIITKEKIDFVIPIIDYDLKNFPLEKIKSSSLKNEFISQYSDKKKINQYLKKNNIPIPTQISSEELIDKKIDYIVKPINGYGSRGVVAKKGALIIQSDFETSIVEEICEGPEITVDVFKVNERYRFVARERLEVKSGVCVKCRFVKNKEIGKIVRDIVCKLNLPNAFCFQLMINRNQELVVTDLNLRLGAGSSMSGAAGFDIARACFELWTGENNDPFEYLNDIQDGTVVVRVFNDLVM